MKELMNKQLQAINFAFNGTTLAYSMLARKLGLSYNSLMVLYSIEMNEIQMNKNCTQKLICDETQLPKSTVHSILLDFIKKEYLTLQTRPENKKEKIIFLTPLGEKYIEEIMAKVHSVENKALLKLGTELSEQFVKLNIEFYEAFKKEVENE